MAAKPVNQALVLGMFEGIEKAKASFAANYLKPGLYYLRIDRLTADKTRKEELFLAIEMTVVHVLDDAEGMAHRVGESVTHMMMRRHDSFLGNAKAFAANVLGCLPEEVTQQNVAQLCMDEQPLTGLVVEVQSRNTITKTGKPFTNVNYKREVPVVEYSKLLTDKARKLFVPGFFDAAIEAAANTPAQ